MRDLLATAGDERNVEAEQAGSTLTVDLDAVSANWSRLRRVAGRTECAAVVKANAYGLGLAAVVETLRATGCRTFFVAHLFEGQQLRSLAPEATIYVLNGLMPRTAPLFVTARLRPVLGSVPEIEDWLGATARARAPCALQIDSGMNRLGFITEQLATAAKLTARLDLSLVLSHFVWSGRNEHRPLVERQIALFDAARAHWPGIPASLANSSGIFYGPEAHFDLVRPGYAMFGGNPTPDADNPMKPVATFEAKVIQVHDVAAGDSVGYDARWIAPSPRRLATISAGYADGIPRGKLGTDGGPPGLAYVDGALCPFVGRVSMDLIVLDVTNAPTVERGDTVELLGNEVSVDDLARRAGTIGYEILARLGPRSHRRTISRKGAPLQRAL